MSENRLRRRVWQILEIAEPGDRPSWIFDVSIRALIAVNVVVVVVETVPAVDAAAGSWLEWFELFSVAVFTAEYVLRVWSSGVDPRYARPVVGRVRYAATPLALIDLLAILPSLLPAAGFDLRILRGVRLFRLFRILKIARYSRALRTFGRVFRAKSAELVLTLALVAFLVLVASATLYYVESPAQPDVFSSVPAAMWWGIVTLTTVGYGDVYPITVAGRIVGGVFALTAILIIALPTAILGAAFVRELEGGSVAGAEPDPAQVATAKTCPHCGLPIHG